MKSMFRPIKKIFTYIQKNASNGTMFGSTNSINNTGSSSSSGHEAGNSATSRLSEQEQTERDETEKLLEQQRRRQQHHHQLLATSNNNDEDDDDIERQIKTSIIDASKVNAAAKVKMVLPLQLQLDDELADFAQSPLVDEDDVELGVDDDDEDLDEQFLELDNFPNNEIIVLGSDNELNSSLASDNISEDPLAIDDFSSQRLDEPEEEVETEADSSADLLWLKLDATPAAPTAMPSAAIKITPTKPKEEELRSDGGSDSGLGCENDRHNTTPLAAATITATSTAAATTTTTTVSGVAATVGNLQKPLRSNLKRRLHDDEMDLALGTNISSSSGSNSCTSSTPQKRAKRCINFDNVKVYYFPRQQGFSCVPTVGGCTLGMGACHIAFKTMTLAEHAAELRRAHRSQNQEHQPHHQSQQQLQARSSGNVVGASSSDDSEESEEDYLSEGSGSDADDGSNGFLQPVTPKQRRALLKAAGVRKIDASEKSDCRDIRNSREVCGCSCREFCDPETCACSQAGIKCQVDRAMFPCGCTREACGNTVGRVEFNPTRVRTHYIHTVMRLDMEQRQSQGTPATNSSSNSLVYGSTSPTTLLGVPNAPPDVVAANAAAAAVAAAHCYYMQSQSNYSSGYASPAYTPETSISYYQQQQQTPQTVPAVLSASSPGSAGVVSSGATVQQTSYVSSYPQLDSLDSGLFASGSNATPSYGELLTPTYHPTLSYGGGNQLNSYNAYQSAMPAASVVGVGGYSSCAVPSVPPFGNATTTASNATQYQHASALETTAASMNTASNSNSISIVTASSCSTGLSRISGVATDFINLNTPLSSSSRLSQINDLLQHNRNTTAALVAVSEGYAAMRSSSSSTVGSMASGTSSTTIDSIDTPPIVVDTQCSRLTFEELPPPPPHINPAPIVAVVEHKQLLTSVPQPRQPLDGIMLVRALPGGSGGSSGSSSH